MHIYFENAGQQAHITEYFLLFGCCVWDKCSLKPTLEDLVSSLWCYREAEELLKQSEGVRDILPSVKAWEPEGPPQRLTLF